MSRVAPEPDERRRTPCRDRRPGIQQLPVGGVPIPPRWDVRPDRRDPRAGAPVGRNDATVSLQPDAVAAGAARGPRLRGVLPHHRRRRTSSSRRRARSATPPTRPTCSPRSRQRGHGRPRAVDRTRRPTTATSGIVNSMTIEDGLFVDVGGGSAQVGRITRRALERTLSAPIGAVRMTEAFLPPRPDQTGARSRPCAGTSATRSAEPAGLLRRHSRSSAPAAPSGPWRRWRNAHRSIRWPRFTGTR